MTNYDSYRNSVKKGLRSGSPAVRQAAENVVRFCDLMDAVNEEIERLRGLLAEAMENPVHYVNWYFECRYCKEWHDKNPDLIIHKDGCLVLRAKEVLDG